MTFMIRRTQPRFFEPFFRYPFFDETTLTNGAWNPPVDVAEEQNRILVKVEVPGMEEKDLRISFEDGLLTVSGERQFERTDERNYHRIERSYGSFTRAFTLPRSVDASQIVANYRNGVLEIEIPKKEEARPRQIEINAGSKQQIEA
jgi:HSP20 family protein